MLSMAVSILTVTVLQHRADRVATRRCGQGIRIRTRIGRTFLASVKLERWVTAAWALSLQTGDARPRWQQNTEWRMRWYRGSGTTYQAPEIGEDTHLIPEDAAR